MRNHTQERRAMQRLSMPNEVLLPEVERLLSLGTCVTLRTKGNSMLPFIVGNRDCVTLEPTSNLIPGDIVLAHLRKNDRYVLHRILTIKDGLVTLMGDGNLSGKEYCQTTDICGKVCTILRKGKIKIDPNKKTERRKAAIWIKLLPVRRYLLAIYRRIYLRNIRFLNDAG